jgi:hypothetical protein
MARWLPALALASLSFVACSSSQSAPFAGEGTKRGYALDVQFAELAKIPGVRVTRTIPGLIEVRFSDFAVVPAIAAVLEQREPRAVDVEATGNVALDVRRELIMRGLSESSVNAIWNDEVAGVVLRITYRK